MTSGAAAGSPESLRMPPINDLLFLGRTELAQLVSLNVSLSTTPGKRKKKKRTTAETSSDEKLCGILELMPAAEVAFLLGGDGSEEEDGIFQDLSIDVLGLDDVMPSIMAQETEPVRIPIAFDDVENSPTDKNTVDDAMSFVSGILNRNRLGESSGRVMKQKTRV